MNPTSKPNELPEIIYVWPDLAMISGMVERVDERQEAYVPASQVELLKAELKLQDNANDILTRNLTEAETTIARLEGALEKVEGQAKRLLFPQTLQWREAILGDIIKLSTEALSAAPTKGEENG